MDGLLALSKLPGLCLEVMGTGILLVGGVPPEPLREGGGTGVGDSGAVGASSLASRVQGGGSGASWGELALQSLVGGRESARALGLISLMVLSSCLMVCSRLSRVL